MGPTQSFSGHYDCATLPLDRSRDPIFKGATPAGLGEAGRPHSAAARAQLRVEVTLIVLVAYNTRAHLVPTLEHYK